MRLQAINQQNRYNINKNLLIQNTRQNEIPTNNEPNIENSIAFNGLSDVIGEWFGKNYAQKMLDQKWVHSTAEWLAGKSSMMTEHMSTLGALLTSSVYMTRTLTNKNLDQEKRRTLSINQLLCFIVPTFCAYLVNHLIAGATKNLEKHYSGLKQQQLALGEITGDLEKFKKDFGNKLKGFKTLSTLLTFTLIYRYVTPVVITPVANAIGDRLNAKRKAKQEQKNKTAVA